MPSRKIEQQLEKLKSMRGCAPTEDTVLALRRALADRSNLVVARAAAIAVELQLQSLVPNLLTAFEDFFQNPVETDPQCWGKNALSKALKDLDYSESSAFLKGLKHIQMEPVWGKRVDTAAVLRGTCALALVQCIDLPRQEKFRYLLHALTDDETPVRIDGIRALQQMEGIEPALLLRLKAGVGDMEAAVTGQALESLLNLEREAGVPFVAEFLRSGGEVGEEAALALGASRLPGAVTTLMNAWENRPASSIASGMREVLLRAISASRLESAVEFLLKMVRESRERDAITALQALELHRGSADIRRQIKALVQSRPEPAIHEYFREHFEERLENMHSAG